MPERQLLAVFPDIDAARAAAEAVQRMGLPGDAVRIGDHEDEVRALRAEMHEEMSNTWVGPGNVGPFTEEMTKGLVVGSAIGAAVGALIGALAALVFMSNVDVLLRIVVGAAIGGLGGGVLGFVDGGGLGAKGPAEPLAAERGVPVLVRSNDLSVEQTLEEFHPLRIDLLNGQGHPVGTVATDEKGSSVGEVAGGIARKVSSKTEGEWDSVREDDLPGRQQHG